MSSLAWIRFAVAQAVQDLGAADAARVAQRVVDPRIREAPMRDGWACRAGCAACCHLLVCVKPVEAELLVEHVVETFARDAQAALLDRARRIADEVEGLSAGAYRKAHVRCAFLDGNDRCSVYEVRPLKCRVHASRSAEACGSPEGPVPLDTWLTKIGEAAHAGLSEAPTLELHRAFEGACSF